MAPTVGTTASTVDDSQSLPTAAIVFIAIAAYIIVFTIGLLIRQCLLARGLSICPEWVNEMFCASCSCLSCMCVVHLAEICDFNIPTKHSCLDTFCPTKEWCDETFCCCMNSIPGGSLCDDCATPECQCGDCNCACNCQMPECNSINCICFEIQLKQPSAGHQVPPLGEMGTTSNMSGPPGYYGQHSGAGVVNYGQQNPYPNINPVYA